MTRVHVEYREIGDLSLKERLFSALNSQDCFEPTQFDGERRLSQGYDRRAVNIITHLNLSGQLKNEGRLSQAPLRAFLTCLLTTLSFTFIFKFSLYSSSKMYCDFYRGLEINA